jgi:hypothetical protein
MLQSVRSAASVHGSVKERLHEEANDETEVNVRRRYKSFSKPASQATTVKSSTISAHRSGSTAFDV